MQLGIKIALSVFMWGLCLSPAYAAVPDLDPIPSATSKRGFDTDQTQRKYQYQREILGQTFHLELFISDQATALKLADALFDRINDRGQVFLKMQAQVRLAKKRRVGLSPDEFQIISALQNYCVWSEKAFDPTDLPLYTIWGFTPNSFQYHFPKANQIATALQKVSCLSLDLQPLPPTLFVTQSETEINWDSWTPAWLLQQGVDLLRTDSFHAISAARLQTGSLAYYHGAPPDAQAWKVPLPHPRESNEIYAYLYLRDQGLIILGDYQNYFLYNGLRYSNLLDARTGFPEQETVAVYVTSLDVFDGYLLARSAAVLNESQIRGLMKKSQRSELLMLKERNGILMRESFD